MLYLGFLTIAIAVARSTCSAM